MTDSETMAITRRGLVTGATGFVGKRLLSVMASGTQWRITGATRSAAELPPSVTPAPITDLTEKTDWSSALNEVSAVVHLAARVHVMNDDSATPLTEFRRTNAEGTVNLAEQAAAAGVRRFVFVSSIKVNGESTEQDSPFTAEDAPAPVDPYGISKAEAEDALHRISSETGMEVVIIRPPLIYGPGVKANFGAMMQWLSCGVPLPLGRTENERSLLALDNLVDLIITCLDHPAAANQTFLASDDEDVSTSELLRRMGQALGRPARLVPVPPALMRWAARAVGKESLYQRLFGSLQLNVRKTRETLNWTPPLSLDDGLRQAASDFKKD